LDVDHYPLTELWSRTRTFSVVREGVTYNVTVYSHSTVAAFHYSQPKKKIAFNVTGPADARGFCNVTIPIELLGDTCRVLIDDVLTDYELTQSATHSFLYITYVHSTHNIRIIGPDTTPPVARAGGDQTVNEGTLVTLDASGSSDNDVIAGYTWTFTDATPRTLTGEKPTYTFETPGAYNVTLTVFDAGGNRDQDTIMITVLDTDADDDGMPDAWETANGLNPLDPNDASMDPDGDGWTNLQEYLNKTDPNDYFSPFPLWVAGIAVAAVVIAVAAIYLGKVRKKG
jgi:hypothetical protein